MSPEAVRLLDRLGVVAALEAAGAPLQGTVVTAARGSRLHGLFALAGPPPFRPTGLSVSRRILDHALLEAARAAGARGVGAHRGGGAALRRRRGGRRGRARRGRRTPRDPRPAHHRRRRAPLGRGPPARTAAPRAAPALAFVAHVDGVSDMADSAELHVGPRATSGSTRSAADAPTSRWWCRPARAATARGRAEAFFLEALETFPGVRRPGRRRAARAPGAGHRARSPPGRGG